MSALEQMPSNIPSFIDKREVGMRSVFKDYLKRRLNQQDFVEIREEFNEHYPEDPGYELDYLEASLLHEEANKLQVAELVFLEQRATQMGKRVMDLERKERYEIYEAFPRKETFDEIERNAIEEYGKAAAGYWRFKSEIGDYANQTDAALAQIDLDIRRALREPDDATRNARLDALEQHAEQLYLAIPSLGKKAEHLIAALIRKRARKNGKDHVVSASVATLAEDMKDKIDVRLTIGAQIVDLQLKTLAIFDAYSRESTEEKVADGFVKMQGKPVTFAIIPENSVRDIIRAEMTAEDNLNRSDKVRKTRGVNAVMNMLEEQMPDFVREAFHDAIEQPPSSSRRTGSKLGHEGVKKSRLSSKEIERTPSRILEMVGMMPSTSRTPDDFRNARKSLSERIDDLKKAGVTKEDLLEPKDSTDPRIEKIRNALGLE